MPDAIARSTGTPWARRSLTETFDYLGMHFGGMTHVNCRDRYIPSRHDVEASSFARLLKDNTPTSPPAARG